MTRIINRLRSRRFWKDALERAGVTAVQAIAALGIVMPVALADIDWYTVAGVGLAPALASVLWSVFSMPGIDAGLPWWQAIAYRAGKTFAVSLIGVLTVSAVNIFEIDWQGATSAAVVAALIAVGKNIVAPPVETAVTLQAFSYWSDVTDDPMVHIVQASPAGDVEAHVPDRGAPATPPTRPAVPGASNFKRRT